jgi:predicted nucleic acid-binding protein
MVIDASFMLALLLPDEEIQGSAEYWRMLSLEGATVPTHWNLEIANALLQASRRSRITYAYRTSLIQRLNDLPIRSDLETISACFYDAMALADTHKLTAYDASYLELAIRTGSSLATLDKALAESARKEGVRLIGFNP